MLAPPDVIGECSNPTAIRRLSIREESAIRTKNKFDKEKSLFDLFTSLNVKSEEEFNGWLKMDPSQLPEIWAKYGQNWRVKLREYIEICVKTKRGRFDKPFYEIPYLERVIQSDCTDELHDPHPNDGAFYISEIFKQNDIDVRKFLDDVNSIICMNALVLRGPTTTGKSLIAKNIVKPYNYGTVSRDGDATAFYLQNLLDHEVALMEEPRISMATVQNFKELLAGSKLLVQVKNRGPRDLPRIPCIITTNRALWDDLTDAETGLGVAAFAVFTKLLKDYTDIVRGESQRTGLNLLKQSFLSAIVSGYSGRLYIDSSKLPEFRPFLDKYYLKEEDWDKAISAIVADFHNRGIYFSGRYDEKAKEYELQYQAQQALIKQSMSKNNNKDVDPPVLLSSLPKKLKLAGQAASAVAAMANMLPGPGAPLSTGEGKSSNPPPGDERAAEAGAIIPNDNHSLPREEWLFKGNMFHWTTIRFPIREIAQIPECDVFKPCGKYGDNDNIFLLDNLTMYPFTCWLNDTNSSDALDNADLAFGCYKKWRVKRVHYKLSQFRTVTTRTIATAGQNRTVTGEDSNGRILYASDQSGSVQFLSLDDSANSVDHVNTSDFIRSSIYMGGSKVRAKMLGNPLCWEDVKWMNENSVITLNYNFDDTYLGRTMWFKKLWNYTWSNTNKDKPWGRHNL
ncbi:unnamed protein product [Hymenolepis diminuta]|uniref:Parvovirus non-structural protein 1 helicase domain-containing protein n=1 Tax=Hymenolepis diminuta TaxID=6216 RepID=A0A564Y8V1_HYMDI|nr:unnamed protein product [Hymenolepis diminuta]